MEMISPKEAGVRKAVGASILSLTALMYFFLHPSSLSPWVWMLLTGVGVGVARTGTEKE